MLPCLQRRLDSSLLWLRSLVAARLRAKRRQLDARNFIQIDSILRAVLTMYAKSTDLVN